MTKTDKSKKDYEKSWLVKTAVYDKETDIPVITTADGIPSSIISFTKSNSTGDFSQWVHFYEQDKSFSCLWNNPEDYVEHLRKFEGIISPDISICSDYPIPVQYYNKYRNHALAHWFATKQIPVIPNVRWANKESYDICFSGIEKNRVVAVGSHGQMQKNVNKELFIKGLPEMVSRLTPHTIIVYGTAPKIIWDEYRDKDINIIHIKSETERYHATKKGGK
jgi:hypothetical protein